MSDQLSGKRVAFLATDGVEQVELVEPWSAVDEAGATAELISIHGGEIQGVNGVDKADTFRVARTVERADEQEFDALVIPGGVANPDKLRMNEVAVAFVRSFFQAGKPIAAICHGVQLLTAAGVVLGRRVSCYPACSAEVELAGGQFVPANESFDNAHTHGNLVTAPAWPAHPAWMRQFLAVLATPVAS